MIINLDAVEIFKYLQNDGVVVIPDVGGREERYVLIWFVLVVGYRCSKIKPCLCWQPR